MDKENNRWQICSEKDHSTEDHDNNQLGAGTSPMYLDKYFFSFSFAINKFAIY
jgi:hypothetical protein